MKSGAIDVGVTPPQAGVHAGFLEHDGVTEDQVRPLSHHQPRGIAVEVEPCSGVPAQGCCRAGLADGTAKGRQNGVGLARAGDDDRDDRCGH